MFQRSLRTGKIGLLLSLLATDTAPYIQFHAQKRNLRFVDWSKSRVHDCILEGSSHYTSERTHA